MTIARLLSLEMGIPLKRKKKAYKMQSESYFSLKIITELNGCFSWGLTDSKWGQLPRRSSK